MSRAVNHRVSGVRTDAPVRQASLREHNLALVLRHVVASPRPPSRADLAAATGLTRATVSALVDDLLTGRLLAEVDPPPRTRAGRPASGLRLSTQGPAGLGLEINIDYLAACLVDLSGAVLHRRVVPADQRSSMAARSLADVAELAAEARAEADRAGVTIAGAALAVPGLVDSAGVVRLAPNLGWRGVDARTELAAAPQLAGLPIGVDNEANLAALGELHAGDPGSDSFVYVSGEIGIGAGIVLSGALFRGARGWSGELGHLAVDRAGPRCHCGARGCLEQYAGQEAILRAAGCTGTAAPTGTETPTGALTRLAARARQGDEPTLTALAGAGTALGVAIAGMVNILDVDTVVLGGVFAPLFRWLQPGITAEIVDRVLTAAWSPVQVRASALGGAAAMVGAAGSVVRAIREQPAGWLARS